jgi:serine/threonine protein kinase
LAADDTASRFGRYELRGELGRGTMGVVYEAWDPVLGRRIALKTIGAAFTAGSPDQEAYERRFLSEARAAARLSHPGIVVVHDVGREGTTGPPYMALEYLVGETLEARLEREAMPWREALRIVGRVADALHHAHAQGVIHRDIKPANIMLLPSGEPKIMDFGVARVDSAKLTSPGELFGTPLYMAPEQVLGEPVDARTDLFSLGSVLYTALAGRPPFAATNLPGILTKIVHRDQRPPSEVAPGLPPDADYLIARAMAKAPASRYPDGRTLAEDIEDVREGRPPRHRGEWTPGPAAAGTIVSRRPLPEVPAELPVLELIEPPPPAQPVPPPAETAEPRKRRRTAAPLLLLLLAAAAAAYFFVHAEDREFWKRSAPRLAAAAARYLEGLRQAPPVPVPAASPTAEPSPAAPPPPVDSGPTEAEASEPSAAADAPPGDTAESVPGDVVEAAPLPSPAAEASAPPPPAAPSPSLPAPSPEASPSPWPAGAPRPATRGHLMVEVQHELGKGSLEVWVDGSRALRETLDKSLRRKPVSFSTRGGAPQALALLPGRHQIEVRIRTADNRRSARTAGVFKAGGTRRLEVRVDRRGTPTLAWKAP